MRCRSIFLSSSASALPLTPFPFHPCLLNITRIQPPIIQQVPRRRVYYPIPLGEEWNLSVRNIRLESRYVWVMDFISICSFLRGYLIRSNSRFGFRSNPNFYKVDVLMRSPPGSYYITDFKEKTAEELELVSLIKTHATPVSSIHDIAESIASEIQAKFPSAVYTTLVFQQDVRKNFKIDSILKASCRFHRVSTDRERLTVENNSMYDCFTEWHFPIPLRSGHVISLYLITRERSESAVHYQTSRLKTPRSRFSLTSVHPTFGLHEEVARFAKQLQSGSAEGAALLLAQCLFHLADKQSPCKRLQRVTVKMSTAIPLKDPSRSEAVIAAERSQREFVNETFSACKIVLMRHQYEQSQRSLLSTELQSGLHRVLLALGSNLGNRVEMIESAVREMGDRGLTVVRTSALYETEPMYLEKQESFINGACEVRSTKAILHRR